MYIFLAKVIFPEKKNKRFGLKKDKINI